MQPVVTFVGPLSPLKKKLRKALHAPLEHPVLSLIGILLSIFSVTITIMHISLTNRIEALENDKRTLSANLEASKIQAGEESRKRDKIILDILASTPNTPVLTAPANVSNLVGTFATLEWQHSPQNPVMRYVVEVRGPSDYKKSEMFEATNPTAGSTRFPTHLTQSIPHGTYLWRVVPGHLQGKEVIKSGEWSGFYEFTFFPTALQRIKHTCTLLVGVTFNQHSEFITRDAEGSPAGIDWDLVKAITAELEKDPDIRSEDCKQRKGFYLKPDHKPYSTNDILLYEGLLKGEVDLAIGSLTKTKDRMHRGIRFSPGYMNSEMVLLSKATPQSRSLNSIREITKEDRIGVVTGTTNFIAATEILRHTPFKLIPKSSFEDLVKALAFREVNYVINDEPVARPLINAKELAIVLNLQPFLPEYMKDIVGHPVEEFAIALDDREDKLAEKIDRIMNNESFKQQHINPMRDHLRHAGIKTDEAHK